MLIAVARHSAAAGQNTVVLLIKPQRIDNLIEFALKGLGFQLPTMVKPGEEKSVSRAAHIATQMAQASSRCVYLLIVAITVLLL